jgi:hypothetical protein
MPTPTHVFAEVAATHGNVDPGDIDAVQRWYENELPLLPAATIEEILEELASQEGSAPVAADSKHSYPSGAPLPSLGQSKPVPLPLLAAGWRAFIRRWLGGGGQ